MSGALEDEENGHLSWQIMRGQQQELCFPLVIDLRWFLAACFACLVSVVMKMKSEIWRG